MEKINPIDYQVNHLLTRIANLELELSKVATLLAVANEKLLEYKSQEDKG